MIAHDPSPGTPMSKGPRMPIKREFFFLKTVNARWIATPRSVRARGCRAHPGGEDHIDLPAVQPPSITKWVPVQKLASSLAR